MRGWKERKTNLTRDEMLGHSPAQVFGLPEEWGSMVQRGPLASPN